MKASGSFDNLVQGVSQQAPQDRREGQIGEMVNMMPDPVNGLSRRHGSKWVAERDTGLAISSFAELQADTATWRSFKYSNAGKEYVVLYRTGERPVGSTMPPMVVYNKTDSKFLPTQRSPSDTVLNSFEAGGCSAITSIGKYVFAAGHTMVPAVNVNSVWANPANQDKSAVWVRGGGYSRTFKVSAIKTDGATINFEYTTPKSSYSGILDTSAIPQLAADPEGGTDTRTEGAYIQLITGTYQHTLTWAKWSPTGLTAKKGTAVMTNVSPATPANSMQYAWAGGSAVVTFHSSNLGATDVTLSYTSAKTVVNPNYAQIVTTLTNEYNSAVTKHIGDAAEAIQPQAIAEKLKLAAVAAGLTLATRQDSTIILEGVKYLTVQDGGDGSLIRGVANEVASADQVSNIHIVGKVVKVRARGSEEAYYLKAVAKDGVSTGYTEVSWVEGAGVVYTIYDAIIMCTVEAGIFYMASSAALLNSIVPGQHPSFVPSSVGDELTSPKPFFIGRKITYLGVFQDRLLIGSGGVIRASRIGDYFNLFRTSVLTVPANDALEMLSQSTEDDEIRYGVLYDRDLVLFGAKRQYAVTGKFALSPTNANMPVVSSHEGASDIPPLSAGGSIFYSKQGEEGPSVHEIKLGVVAESPESFSISSQLSTYFKNAAVELASLAKPTMLFLRTKGERNTIYPFTYLDTSQGRRQDAWGKWLFDDAIGPIFGMVSSPGGLMVFSLRSAHGKVWTVADVCPVSTGVASYPYLDSIRPWDRVGSGSLRIGSVGNWKVAFDKSTVYRFVGDSIANVYTLFAQFPAAFGAWAGASQEAYFVPTNPFVKDRKGASVLTGRLTVTKLNVAFKDSSGFKYSVETKGGTESYSFNGLVVGDDPLIGRVPVSTGAYSVPIGKETREYSLKFSAHTWLPFTVTNLEWVGQFFNNTQRLG